MGSSRIFQQNKRTILLLIILMMMISYWYWHESSQKANKDDTVMYADKKQLQSHSPIKKERKKHLVYVKIEKTGSTTMSNIFSSFGMVHNLNMMMSTMQTNMVYTGESEPGKSWLIGPDTSPPLTGHVMEQHAKFNAEFYARYFPADTVYMSSLRNPTSWLISYVDYYVWVYGKSKPRDVLHDNNLFYKKRGDKGLGLQYTVHNTMLQWFGFDMKHSKDEKAIMDFIKWVDGKFGLMLITEYFDEGLILLRRIMNWSFTDIFYARVNDNLSTKSGTVWTQEEINKILDKDHNRGDYLLYQHFNQSFWKKVESMPDFREEVALFREHNKKTLEYCQGPESKKEGAYLELSSKWEGTYQVKDIDCLKMRYDDDGISRELSDALDKHVPGRRKYKNFKEVMDAQKAN